MSVKYSRETLDEIRARIDLVSLIGTRGVDLKRAGGLYKGRCPFHQEKTPSFVVYPADQSFHCFGCQAHGGAFDFLMRSEGLTFVDAVEQLARQAGIKLETETDVQSDLRRKLYALHDALAAFYRRCLLQAAEGGAARDYLRERALDEDIGEKFLIGYAPRRAGALQTWAGRHDWPLSLLIQAGLMAPSSAHEKPSPDSPAAYYDRFRGRLMFPIRDPQGRIVAFSGRLLDNRARAAKYVNSPDTAVFHKGRILYGLDRARQTIVGLPHREALVCEGQIDVIRCHAAGFGNAVAAQGTAFTVEHAQLLHRYADSVVLVFDADAAGGKASLRTAGQLMAAGMPVRIAQLPEGEDPDSFLRRAGADALRERLEQAESVVPFQVRLLRQAETQPDAVDALERVARAVLSTLAQASSAIQRARLLQEAAHCLNLPEKALALTLEEHLQTARRTPPAAAVPPASIGPSVRSMHDRAGFDPAAAVPDAPVLAGKTDPGAASPIAPPSPEETALCELICQHEDDPAIVVAVQDYLPMDFVAHPACRRILAAAIETRMTDQDMLMRLQESDADGLGGWIGRFATADHRVAGAREATPEAAAHDCILRLWRRRLEAERKALSLRQADTESSEAARMSERWALTTLMNRLTRVDWSTAQPLLMAELRRRQAAGGQAQSPGEHAAESEA